MTVTQIVRLYVASDPDPALLRRASELAALPRAGGAFRGSLITQQILVSPHRGGCDR